MLCEAVESGEGGLQREERVFRTAEKERGSACDIHSHYSRCLVELSVLKCLCCSAVRGTKNDANWPWVHINPDKMVHQ